MTESFMENRKESDPTTSDVLLSLPGIRITTSWLTIADRRYSVLELRDLRTQRGPFDPVTTRTGLATMIGIALLGATVRSLPPIGLLGAVIAIGVLAALTAITAWRRPRGYGLWAESHGLTLQLYYSDDQRIFGHVCRTGLRRGDPEPAPLRPAPRDLLGAAPVHAQPHHDRSKHLHPHRIDRRRHT
jgi:hypothetical protein